MKEEENICQLCEKGFASKYNLKDHIQDTHCEQENAKCNLCGVTFLGNRNLQRGRINLSF